MASGSEIEILIDPIVLSLVWSKFASNELRRERDEQGEAPPSDLEDDNYSSETSTAIFGENQPYPLDFFKGVLLFTTRIRTPFSGKKFLAFKEMLYDQVAPEHHDQLSQIRPLFDDVSYQQFRHAEWFDERPWDFSLPGEWGQAVKHFFRFLNEDASSDILIDDILELSWPDGEPLDFSMGLPQLLTDYLAVHQFSFGLNFFSFNDASAWTRKPFSKQQSEAIKEILQRNLEHAISITFPKLSVLSFDDLLDLRRHRFFECYRTIVRDGGLQGLSEADLNEMMRKEILRSTEEAAYGLKETLIDLAKLVASFVPGVDQLVGIGGETLTAPSRFRRYKNRWLWFVMNAREKSGNLFRSLAEPQT